MRDPAAEDFVRSNTARLISILRDPSRSQRQKTAAVREAFEAFVDLGPLSEFVLGKYARTITPQQHARFVAALHSYGQRLVRWWVANYRGEALQVTGSSRASGGDVVVYSKLSGGRFTDPRFMADRRVIADPTLMVWRVVGSDAGWKVIDVQWNGGWLGELRRSEFASALDAAHGDVDVLISRLNKLPRR